MKLTCEYELDILSNTKGSLAKDHGDSFAKDHGDSFAKDHGDSFAKDHGENCMKLRPVLTSHHLRNHLFLFLKILK